MVVYKYLKESNFFNVGSPFFHERLLLAEFRKKMNLMQIVFPAFAETYIPRKED